LFQDQTLKIFQYQDFDTVYHLVEDSYKEDYIV